MKHHLWIMSFLVFLLSISCMSAPIQTNSIRSETERTEVTVFRNIENEEFYNSKLIEILKKKDLKVFFRGQNDLGIFSEENIDSQFIYDIFEKSLFLSGFTIRDRSLTYQTYLRGNADSFSSIRDSIDTDLIFEFSDINLDQQYVTDKYYDGHEYHISDEEINATGLKITIKIIIVETGEVGGYFTIWHIYHSESDGVRYALLEEKIYRDDSGVDQYISDYSSFSVEPLFNNGVDYVYELENVAQDFVYRLLHLRE